MHVERYGKGSRVFLAIHGWGGDHREFAPLAARLPADASLYSVDLPGYGQSPRPARWDADAVVAELLDAWDRLPLRDVTLIGFCSGAVLALMVAHARPGQVRRIVMIDPFAYLPWYFRIFTAGGLGRRFYRTAFVSAFGRRVTTWVLRKRQSTNDDFMGAFGRVDHENTQQWLALLHRIGGVRQFAGLSMPLALAHGERTFAAVRDSVQTYRSLFPQTQVHVLRNVGHLPMVRGAKQLAAILFDGQEMAAGRNSGSSD